MHLSQIGLRRIGRHPRAMFHGRAAVRIALDALSGQQAYAGCERLAERMAAIAGDGNDGAGEVACCHDDQHDGVQVSRQRDSPPPAAASRRMGRWRHHRGVAISPGPPATHERPA